MASPPIGEYTSTRGLVFPTDREEGWFDSATVGSPRVHRCERDLGRLYEEGAFVHDSNESMSEHVQLQLPFA